LTFPEILQFGVFCGKYMTDTRDEFPADRFLTPNFRQLGVTAR
jgi:hypothetical protein